MEKKELKENPHYQNGLFWGKDMVKFIDNTVYGDLETAIFRKKELVEDLKKEFGWDESIKDIAENLGIIDALEAALEIQKKEKSEQIISIEDVDRVAKSINKSITLEQAEEIIELFPTAAENDPSATWDLVVENLIHDIT